MGSLCDVVVAGARGLPESHRISWHAAKEQIETNRATVDLINCCALT
jgi:hypothetical protein